MIYMTTTITKHSCFKAELAVAETFQEIKLLESKTAALAEFARKNDVGFEEQNQWGEFRVDIEQKKGEWWDENFPYGVNKKFRSSPDTNSSLKDEGITPAESSNARLIAKE